MVCFALTLVALLSTVSAQSALWYKPVPRALNTYYVAVIAEAPIRDGSKEAPFSIHDVTQEAKPGDTFLLTHGNYKGNFKFGADVSGNASYPVVVRAVPGNRATIVGKVDIDASYFWFMEIEVTDPTNSQTVSNAIDVRGNETRVINCFVHDTFDGHGIVGHAGASGQVIYGNVVSRTGISSGSRTDELPTDGIRVSNDPAVSGTKFVVGNLLVGFDSLCEKCRGVAVHADPDDGDEFLSELSSGVHIELNILHSSHSVIGGYGAPSELNVVKDNLFADSELQIGVGAPTQAEVTGNVIAWSYLDSRYLWTGADPAYGSPSKPNVYSGNTVYHPTVDNDLSRDDDLPLVDIGTARYASADDKHQPKVRPVLGEAPLSGSDSFDRNTYGGASAFFRLHAAGVESKIETIDEWRSATEAAGKRFDGASSVSVAANMSSVVHVIDNLYDQARAHVVVFNFGRAEEVQVKLGDAFLGVSGTYKIYRATDRWSGEDAILAQGSLPAATVAVKVGSERVSSLIVIANDGEDTSVLPTDMVDTCPRFSEGCVDGPCRASGTCLTTTLECDKVTNKCVDIDDESSASTVAISSFVAIAMLSLL